MLCSVQPSDSVARGDMLYTDLRLKMLMLMWITVMLFNKTDSAQTIDVNQPDRVITADVGENVTLHCFRLGENNNEPNIWYKQKVGHEPCLMVTVLTEPDYEDEFKSPRFSIEKEKGSVHLKIANVEPSDEAMYYCGVVKFMKVFGKGTFLSVKGKPDLSVSVFQSGVSDSVPAGASVTLQCSVLSESRSAELQVLWFRAAPPQSHPQIIYTHHNSSHQCESGSSTHTCVHKFSKNILGLNDTGTYYCAVAMCGKIIFGNGTRVQLERSVNPVVIYLTVALGVCVVVIFALIFVITCGRRNCEQRSASLKQGSVTHKTLNQDCDNELNYAALHFNERRAKRGRVKKQQPQDIIYSDVRGLSVT
ncbi:signal-regulatory protein beta-1-like [Ictalurus furcatus]|uniref:signal-regulatory protein beta-1-like n=1 Tax=Ictalurus furcatus TaxID=66913 RepID=UPI00234FBB6B|nr:signal-regulatory protein beta-1-like [Ictalurus furcatus]